MWSSDIRVANEAELFSFQKEESSMHSESLNLFLSNRQALLSNS